jgi:hypothetical protein
MMWRYIAGGLPALAVLLTLATTFLFGAIHGADAAHTGESVAELEAGLEDIPENVVSDVREGSSGIFADLLAGIARNLARSAVAAAGAGLGFGYAYPWLAVPIAKAWPYVMLLAIAGCVYVVGKPVYRRVMA